MMPDRLDVKLVDKNRTLVFRLLRDQRRLVLHEDHHKIHVLTHKSNLLMQRNLLVPSRKKLVYQGRLVVHKRNRHHVMEFNV
jgi:hypothetical protein